jgi:hypothetical protein
MRPARVALLFAVGLGLAPVAYDAAADGPARNPHWRPTLAARRVERGGLPSFTFHGFPDGTTATTIQSGRTSYTTFSTGLTASSTSVGPTTFTSLSDGRTATTQRLGSTALTTFSDGSTLTTSRVGDSTFTGTSPGLSAQRARAAGGYDFPPPASAVAPMPRPAW